MKSPNHIAIIMDGNGRWGEKHFKSRLVGHEYGVKNLRLVIDYILKIQVKNLTVFTLSYDNTHKRKSYEIKNLFNIVENYIQKNLNYLKEKKIKINFVGENKGVPKKIKNLIKNNFIHKKNHNNYNLCLNIAFNYSSKKEITGSVKKIIKKKISVNEKNIEKHLFTYESGSPEILIRTGGYNRLSDFLLWQLSYTELFFLKKLWPDFKIDDLNKIILKYQTIKRNFGA